MRTYDRFLVALAKTSLRGDLQAAKGPALVAALAIESFHRTDRDEYEGDTYLASATTIEMDAMGEPWEEQIQSGPSGIDAVAEVLERMIFDQGLSEGRDIEKEDAKARANRARENLKRMKVEKKEAKKQRAH